MSYTEKLKLMCKPSTLTKVILGTVAGVAVVAGVVITRTPPTEIAEYAKLTKKLQALGCFK